MHPRLPALPAARGAPAAGLESAWRGRWGSRTCVRQPGRLEPHFPPPDPWSSLTRSLLIIMTYVGIAAVVVNHVIPAGPGPASEWQGGVGAVGVLHETSAACGSSRSRSGVGVTCRQPGCKQVQTAGAGRACVEPASRGQRRGVARGWVWPAAGVKDRALRGAAHWRRAAARSRCDRPGGGNHVNHASMTWCEATVSRE